MTVCVPLKTNFTIKLFIKEDDFLKKFKQQGGYRSFMLSGKQADTDKLAVHLEDRLFQHGMEFRNSLAILAELLEVENTYLSIFQGLGGLGMLIGTCGLGLVVVRNLVERGQEFALFEAIGYRLDNIRKFIFLEHAQWEILPFLFLWAFCCSSFVWLADATGVWLAAVVVVGSPFLKRARARE